VVYAGANFVAVSPAVTSTASEDAVYRKVTWRLVPFLMICYGAAYLDRVNVGFAKLQMLSDLHFTETIYGRAAGMFFIGYFLFEIPSNLILHRVGARLWIARIMVTWGLVSALFVFVRTPMMFYGLRFLLGVAEAGFYPGIILYLTRWYPAHRRARVVALFMTAIPLSGIVGGPLSGWIMAHFAKSSTWVGWQWLFIIEAVPSILLGLVVVAYLDNGISSARWLTAEERTLLERNLAQEAATIAEHGSVLAVLGDRRVWVMCLIYFSCVMGQYGLNFWMPTLVQAAGVHGVLHIGLFTAVPYVGAVITMIVLGRSADRHRERRWHTAGALLVGALGLFLTPIAGTHTGAAMTCLTIAAAGVIAAAPLFWSLPTAFLGGRAAAAGIAAINSVANLGGYISPDLVGRLTDLTHSTAAGMYMTAAVVALGAFVVLSVPARLVNK
jgi:D-galactonate transporter